MAIALRGALNHITGVVGNGADVTLTFDTITPPLEDDIVVVFGGHGVATTTLSAPGTGYTQIGINTGSAPIFGMWYKRMGSTPDTSVVCSGGGHAQDAVCYGCYVLSGVDTTTAEDATATTAGPTTSTNPDAASITTVNDNAWVITCSGSDVRDTAIGTISGYSNRLAATRNDTQDVTVGASTFLNVGSDAENPPAWSAWSSGTWYAITAAFREATVGPLTCSGDLDIASPTAAGVSTIFKTATGALTVAAVLASGTSTLFKTSDGTPSIEPITASGAVTQTQFATGSLSIGEITASGVSTIFKSSSGTPTLGEVSASGQSTQTYRPSGTPSIAGPTASGTSTLFNTSTGSPSTDEVTASGTAILAPKVYLNTTQTLAGATEMTVTAYNVAGTSITFTDPAGAPTGSLFLGVENRNNSDVGWIAVTVNVGGDITSNGTPSIDVITANGTVTIFKTSTGALSLAEITASGTVLQTQLATGALSVGQVTASGVSTIFKTGTGTPSLAEITASGAVVQTQFATGSLSVGQVTASGVSTIFKPASGTPSTEVITAAGTVTQTQLATGALSIDVITASGQSGKFLDGNGTPSIAEITASGTASLAGLITANGTPSIAEITAAGTVNQTQFATGSLSLDPVTAAGVSTIFKTASGAITLNALTASGAASITGGAYATTIELYYRHLLSGHS